ncbi:MAG: hypothetical protein AAF449_10205 [Myxococcota bacterium]
MPIATGGDQGLETLPATGGDQGLETPLATVQAIGGGTQAYQRFLAQSSRQIAGAG